MKKNILISLLIIFSAFLINSCDNGGSTGAGGGNEDNSNYFPDNDGAYYKYNTSRTDSEGVRQGTRSVKYSGFKTGTVFHKQIDSSTIGAVTLVSESYFWKSNNGVYYFLDTTGFASNIPPEYRQLIPSLLIDSLFRLLTAPLESDWAVFKIILSTTNSSIISIKATNLGKENFDNGVVSGEAVRIRYDVAITIPFLSPQTLSADCWFVPNIGITKWEGSGTVINALSGGGIDFGDSTTVITQDLIYYNLNQ